MVCSLLFEPSKMMVPVPINFYHLYFNLEVAQAKNTIQVKLEFNKSPQPLSHYKAKSCWNKGYHVIPHCQSQLRYLSYKHLVIQILQKSNKKYNYKSFGGEILRKYQTICQRKYQ